MRNFFESSLSAGHAGELRFMQLVPHLDLKRTDGLAEDFIMPNGETLELKTERRSTAQTLNLAIELASSPGKPGALQRAINDNVTYIVYLFADDVYFVYKPAQLLEAALAQKSQYRTVYVNNGNYDSEVLLLPRHVVFNMEIKL